MQNKGKSVPHLQDVQKCKRPAGNCLPKHGSFIHDSPKSERAHHTVLGPPHRGLQLTNKKNLLIVARRMTLENIVLTKTFQTQEYISHDPFKRNSEQEKLIDDGKKIRTVVV